MRVAGLGVCFFAVLVRGGEASRPAPPGGLLAGSKPPASALAPPPPRHLVDSVCYTATLYDLYGDGWDGAVLSFTNAATGAGAAGVSEEVLTLEEFSDTAETNAVKVCFECGCYFGQATKVQYSEENSWTLSDPATEAGSSSSNPLVSAEGADESATFCTASASCPSYPSSCPKGSGLRSSDFSSCEACPPGRFKANVGSTTCEACAPGTHYAGTGAKICDGCEAGTYSSAGAANCGDCEAGTYGDDATRTCERCAKGRYNSHTGATGASACTGCEEGKYNVDEGSSDASACTVCADGYSSISGSAYCYSESERTSLVALYYKSAGGGANWADFGCGSGWLDGDHCTWGGVICNESGHIERLTLTQCGLTGTLPEEIGNLQRLITLDLGDNFLTGSIPKEIGRLQSVEYLLLQNNTLFGPLPSELGMLRNIQFLILNQNQLSGQLPSELGQLQKLKFLYLHNNTFSGSIPRELGKLKQSLTTLLLSFNRLTGTIPEEIGQLQNLIELGLASNQLEGIIPSQLGELPVLSILDLSNNRLTGPVPSNLQEKCFSLAFGSFVGAMCLLYANDLTCPRGTSLLLSGCMFCPFPERCPGGAKWGDYCSSGFERSDCSVCPIGSYILGDSCLRCASGWAEGFESLVYLLIAISVVLALILLLVKLHVLDPGELFRRLQFDINTIVCMKQLGGLFQILSLVCSVVITPAWYGRLSNVLRAASLPIQINSPCAPGLQSQPKYIQGMVTILLVSVMTTLMAVAPFLPFVKSRVEASTASKIQRLAGVVLGQSALICISATLEQISKTPFKQKENKSDGFILAVLDDREMFRLNDVIAQVVITVLFIWGLSTLYTRSVAKFEESRNASANDQKSADGQASASMLPFYSTFCMPYTPSMSDFDLTVLARKVIAFLLSILFGSLKYYFTLLSPQKNYSVAVACAGMQSTLFIWLNVWYIRRLVKRPYISGRRSHTIGDPLNDTDMLTTRVYIWSSAMLALSSVLNGQEEGNLSSSRATVTNVLCGIIVVALVWPQRLLFLGLRQSLRELLASEKNDERIAAAAKVEDSTMLVEKMMKAMDANALFALQKELLQRGDLSAVERSRWTARASSQEEELDTKSSGVLRCGVWYTCGVKLRKLRKHLAGRVVLRICRLLLGAVVIVLTVGAAYAILQYGVAKRADAGSEYACVCAAALSAVASEVLRVRWTKVYVRTALAKHSSGTSETTEGDERTTLDIPRTAADPKELIELVAIKVGSVGAGNEEKMNQEPKQEAEFEGRATMVINPMSRTTY